MKVCCGSKCPKCWTKQDSIDLYNSLLNREHKAFSKGVIDKETYSYNLERICKYERP